MTNTNPKVDAFMKQAKAWRQEFASLRKILLDCRLTEELKWRLPCYTFQGGNVAIIQGFKEYCAVMFFKGALLKDAEGVLKAPGQSQAGRQIRFANVREIARLESTIKAYAREAIDVEKAGLKVELKKTSQFEVPAEFQTKLNQDAALRRAFQALTPGRQRAYLFYFAAPKQSETRAARVMKSIESILNGKGLSD